MLLSRFDHQQPTRIFRSNSIQRLKYSVLHSENSSKLIMVMIIVLATTTIVTSINSKCEKAGYTVTGEYLVLVLDDQYDEEDHTDDQHDQDDDK